MAVYPGPAGKGAANEAKALPPGYAIEEQRPRQYSLSPLSRQERGGTSNKPLPRTGVRRSLPVQALQEATVVRLPDGRRLWRMNIASPGAMGMRIHFRRFDALGGQLWAYTPQEADRAVESEGPFVNQGPFADGDFWTGILPGESVTIEYLDAASNSEKPLPPFEIDSILHIWERPILPPQDAASVSGLTMNLTGPPPMRGVFPELPSASTAAGDSINEVAACHLDVTCYPNYQGVSKGVVRFNFVGDDGGSYLCSGSMINTQNRSFAPYLLTAYHCIGSDAEARSIVARFFYQTSACNGAAPSLASVPGITGARYLAGAPIPEGDYALVLLNGNVPAGTTFLGWTVAGVNIGNAALGIHHPAGSWKRISFGTRTNDQTANIGSEAAPANLYYRVSWTQGKTEGGSSGSPLLNDLGQILGTLTSGPVVPPGLTVCEINPEIAGYGRFANAYPAIRAYLEDTPPPSLTVTPSSLAFTVNNGQYTGSSQQTLTIRTQSSTALPYSLKASAPWIRLSSASGNVSASAPASVSVSLDLSYFSASTSTTGTVSVSSGTLTPISVSVQANVTITRSKVLATITPNPVYQQAANSDGYASFYTLRLAETGGVATRLTSFKYEGTDISNNIVGWFGSDLLPARGTLSSALRSRTQSVPVTRLFDVAGVDIATGLPWSVQVTVSILARPTKAILVLDSYPNLIRQDPNSTACPWYQQLVLQETGGFGVTLNRFVAAGYDLSGQIAGFWGDTRLSASGSLLGRLCWPAVQAPTTLDMEVGGIDSNGSTVSASVRASFSGPAAYPTTMSASPVSVARNLLVGSTSPVTSTISLSIGSNTATWTGRLVFRDAPNTWLTVWPLSGTGSVTLNLSALPAGLASGTHEATLLLQSTDAIPQLLSIPVRLSITQASPSLASVLGSASFQPGTSSGSWFSVFGTNLAQTTRLWQVSDFAGNRLPTQLDGVSVFVNGKPAPVYYISPTQVNALAPDDSALGPVSVEVVTSQGRSKSMSADKRMFAPAWFMFDAEGRKYLAGVHPDGAYLGKPGLYSGLNLRPAKPGDIVMLYGTGFGPVNPATHSDQLVTQPGRLTSSVVVRIGGAVAVVPWAGLVSPGLYQFNVVVPNLLDGDQAVSAEIGGASSQTGAFITVRR